MSAPGHTSGDHRSATREGDPVNASLLATRDLRAGIGARAFCDALSIDVGAGDVWAIIGPNGAGKTTLLRTLAGLAAPLAGTVMLGGRPLETLSLRLRAQSRGVLPQDDVDAFAVSVADSVLAARHPHIAWHAWERDADRRIAGDALAAFGVADLAARDVRTLSGGERRRVALAELVAQDTPLLLLDEPSSHLDIGQQVAALDALTALARGRRKALVMVLHDLHLAARYCDHAIAIGGGGAIAGAASEILREAPLSALFGRALLELGAGATRTFVPR
ncbi:MAG: ABC transporter ATP-binding protein [Betaproteobacteria bacterium]